MDAILRVVFALVLVFGALWVAARLARRPMRSRRGTAALDVVARTQLSRGASVAVVRVDDKALVLGVTDAGVSLLHQLDAEVFARPAEEPPVERTSVTLPAQPGDHTGRLAGSALSPATWKQALEALRERSARGR